MALNLAQRRYLVLESVQLLLTHINTKYQSLSNGLYKLAGINNSESPFNLKGYDPESNWQKLHIKLDYPEKAFNKEVCASIQSKAKKLSETITEPSTDWFSKQITKNNYTLDIKFESCMCRPKPTLVFPSEEKEITHLRKVFIKNFTTKYSDEADNLSELRAVLLEANKKIKAITKKAMLCGNKEAIEFLEIVANDVKSI